jgi:metal-responsive CopG/Arc/MetJ family transcriptional regulator
MTPLSDPSPEATERARIHWTATTLTLPPDLLHALDDIRHNTGESRVSIIRNTLRRSLLDGDGT